MNSTDENASRPVQQPTREGIEQARQLVDQAERIIADHLDSAEWPTPEIVERFMSDGHLARTIGLYLRAVHLDPLEPAYPWNLASTLSRLGLNAFALGLIGRAIQIGTVTRQNEWTGAAEHLALAEAALDAGLEDMAMVALAYATEIDPGEGVRAQARRLLDEVRARGCQERPELALADRLSQLSA